MLISAAIASAVFCLCQSLVLPLRIGMLFTSVVCNTDTVGSEAEVQCGSRSNMGCAGLQFTLVDCILVPPGFLKRIHSFHTVCCGHLRVL